MELIESAMWVAVGFGPTLAALVGISKAGIFRIHKYGRIAKVEIGYPRFGRVKEDRQYVR